MTRAGDRNLVEAQNIVEVMLNDGVCDKTRPISTAPVHKIVFVDRSQRLQVC